MLGSHVKQSAVRRIKIPQVLSCKGPFQFYQVTETAKENLIRSISAHLTNLFTAIYYSQLTIYQTQSSIGLYLKHDGALNTGMSSSLSEFQP